MKKFGTETVTVVDWCPRKGYRKGSKQLLSKCD